MSNLPLVSIVTPTYQPGNRLERCLRNVAGQTYPRIEHIVVDGGSTDGSVSLLEASSIKWVSGPDEGQTDALIKGFAMAEGDYIAWLGADDLLEPNAIELAVTAISALPGFGFCYGKVRIRRPNRSFIVESPSHLSLADFSFLNPVWQPGSLIARWAYDEVGGLDKSFHYAMDFDLWLRLVHSKIPSTYIPHVLAEYEIHSESKTGSVGIDVFIMECYRSYLKLGLKRWGILALGRAAANAAANDFRVDETRLADEIARFSELGRNDGAYNPKLVEVAARTEAAVIELQRSPSGLRHAMRPGPWITSETRHRLLLAAKRGLVRLNFRGASQP